MKGILLTVREVKTLVWWAHSGVEKYRGGSYQRLIIGLIKKLSKFFHKDDQETLMKVKFKRWEK